MDRRHRIVVNVFLTTTTLIGLAAVGIGLYWWMTDRNGLAAPLLGVVGLTTIALTANLARQLR